MEYAFAEGFMVQDVNLGDLGKILSVEEFPQQEMAFVDYKGKEILIPMIDAFIIEIDKKENRILVELPETCLLASYFLKKNFPNKKILLYSQAKDETIKFSDYDFIILPQTAIGKIANESMDLVINTSSLSEMENETQNFYMNEIERIAKSYFYSVNRHGFKMHKYNAQGFYNLKFNKRWNTLIYKFTHTYQLEFLGERIK